MGLYEDLKAKSPFSLAFHDDADGIYSATLISLTEGLEIKTLKTVPSDSRKAIECPEIFGDYKSDVAVDLGPPLNPNWNGICIDHHPDHPAQRKYKLYFDNVPTTLIVWNELKDHIPKDQWWRVVGGLMGDSSVEMTPDIVWDMFPDLFYEKGKMYSKGFSGISISRYPVYVYLSSGINALCRLGDPLGAYEMAMKWKRPIDAVRDNYALDAKKMLDTEEASIMRNSPIVEIIKNKFLIVKIKSRYSMAGKIASTLSSKYQFLTIVVINEQNGEVSMRGVLAKYVANKLKDKGFKAGGHSNASGAKVEPERIEELMDVLRGL